VCNVYPGDPHCPGVGWAATFNASLLVNGVHTIGVTATDSEGRSGQATQSVVVGNATSSALIWVQPQASAGFGPPGSLIVAGSAATGGPAGFGVQLWWQDQSLGMGAGWNLVGYASTPGSGGVWTNSIPNVINTHEYLIYAVYNGVSSRYCEYPGSNGIYWCP
jgi:hypothetical protein